MNRTLRTLMIAGAAAGFASSLALAQPGTSTPGGVDPATHAAHVAQSPAAHQPADTPSSPTNADLVNQVAQLRAQVAQLQSAIAQGHSAQQPGQGSAGATRKGMKNKPMGQGMQGQMGTGQMGGGQPPSRPSVPGGMSGMSGAGAGGGMMGDDMDMMGGMSGGGTGGGMMPMDQMMMGGMGGGGMGAAGGGGAMPMMDKMMSMGMSRMGGGMNTGDAMSSLPGFPGASHIYHLGATGFFLDHATHITLTVEQQKQLGEIKEKALADQATLERKIEQGEQDLWNLTASDQPDATMIEAKAGEIEKSRSQQRVEFIRAVGRAAQVLTDDQRKQLTGMAPPNPAPQPAGGGGAMPGMGGGGGGGMSDM